MTDLVITINGGGSPVVVPVDQIGVEVTRPGPQGAQGPAATVAIGAVTTGAPGSAAAVVNAGTATNAVLDFAIPRGDQGAAGQIAIGAVTTGAPGSAPTVTNAGTAEQAVLDFSLPAAPSVAVGAVTTGAPGSAASVTNAGTAYAPVLSFTLPRGDQGATGETPVLAHAHLAALVGQAWREAERIGVVAEQATGRLDRRDASDPGAGLLLAAMIGQIARQVDGGRIRLTAGTLADPAILIGDVALYSAIANTLSVAVAGVERLRITTSGITVFGTVTQV